MKTIRSKKVACILIAILLFGCSSSTEQPINEDVRVYEQLGMVSFSTEDGFYFTNSNGYLYFFDYGAKKTTLVCSSASCKTEANLDESSEAYVGLGSGFVYADKLYLFKPNPDLENKFSLIESNLDRSGQKELTKINSAVIRTFAVVKDTVYIAVDELIISKNENGATVEESKHASYILAINLTNGNQKKMMTPMTDFNNQISIIAASEQELYITYSFFETYFDGSNYAQANETHENYMLNITNEELTPILKDRRVEKASYVNGRLFTLEREKASEPKIDSEKHYMISESSSPYAESSVIAKTNVWPIFNEEEWIYQDGETNQYNSFNLQSKEIEKRDMKQTELFISGDAKEYYFVMYSENSGLNYGFILKSDYLKGNKNVLF